MVKKYLSTSFSDYEPYLRPGENKKSKQYPSCCQASRNARAFSSTADKKKKQDSDYISPRDITLTSAPESVKDVIESAEIKATATANAKVKKRPPYGQTA